MPEPEREPRDVLRDLWSRFHAIICSVAVVCLLVVLQNVLADGILHLDYFMYRFFIIQVRQSWLTPVMQAISELAIPSVLLMVLITIQAFAPGRRPGFTVALNLVGVLLLNSMFAFFTHRSRPDGFRLIAETGYSFPSAHAMIAMAFYGLLAWIVWHYEKDRVIRIVAAIAYGMVGVMVGISRIYLGAHYASDVIAGFCLSIAWLALFTALVVPYVLPRRRTSLGLNDTVLGLEDRRDRRRHKPRHFETARRLFAMGLRRTASRVDSAEENEERVPASAAHTNKGKGRHSGRRTSAEGAKRKETPKRRHSRTPDVINVMPTVEPRPEARTTASAASQAATQQAAEEQAELRATAAVAASAAATARRNASNTGAIINPNASGPLSPSTTGSFMVRPGATGPITTGRPLRPNSTGGMRPSATGPISTGRKLSPGTTGSFAPVSANTPAGRRKLKPSTTGAFATVRTVGSPNATGSFPPVRPNTPGTTGPVGTTSASAAKAPAEKKPAAEKAPAQKAPAKQKAAAPKDPAEKKPAAEAPKQEAPAPKAPAAEEKVVVDAPNVKIEDKKTDETKAPAAEKKAKKAKE